MHPFGGRVLRLKGHQVGNWTQEEIARQPGSQGAEAVKNSLAFSMARYFPHLA
jgi:hypothetical protein